MMTFRSLAALALCLALPGTAAANEGEYHVDAATRFEAYEINVPGSPVVMVRRRLLQSLGFAYAQALGDPEDPVGRLVIRSRVRLDFDFGSTCRHDGGCLDAFNEQNPAEYVPIALEGGIDVPELSVGLVDLAHEGELRAGRLLRLGTIGMVRYDGFAVGVSPTSFLRLEAYGGAQVRLTSIAGSLGFEPLGSLRVELPETAPPLPQAIVAEPSRTYVAGVDLETRGPKFARARLGFRESFDGDGLVLRRLSFGASSDPVDALHLQADGVVDLRDGALIDIVAVTAHRRDRAELRVVVERHEPRFDPGTIWGWFDLVPVATARLGTDVQITRALRAGADVRARRSDFGDDDIERGLGAEVRGAYRLPGGSIGISGEAQGGDLGPYGSLRAYADHRLGHAASLELTASVFHFDDRLRVGYHGLSVHESAAVAYRISREALAQLRLEHAYSALIGHRFRGYFVFLLELWR